VAVNNTPRQTCANDEVRLYACGGGCSDGLSQSEVKLSNSERWPRFRIDKHGRRILEPGFTSFEHMTDDPLLSVKYRALDASVEDACCVSTCESILWTGQGSFPARTRPVTACREAPESGTESPAPAAPECPQRMAVAVKPDGINQQPRYHIGAFQGTDGTSPLTGLRRCCYESREVVPPRPLRGRALRTNGAITTAAWRRGTGWSTRVVLGDHADAPDRWLHDAAMEHASVAAFAKLSLQLLALGAPPELIADTHRAALDEIAHARISYGIAAALSGVDREPGPIDMRDLSIEPDLVTLTRETFRDGCCAETIATCEAREAAARTDCETLRAAQERIADDEQRHAELAWRIVAWAVRRSPTAAQALAEEMAAVAHDDDEAIRSVVMPCATALLSATTARA